MVTTTTTVATPATRGMPTPSRMRQAGQAPPPPPPPPRSSSKYSWVPSSIPLPDSFAAGPGLQPPPHQFRQQQYPPQRQQHPGAGPLRPLHDHSQQQQQQNQQTPFQQARLQPPSLLHRNSYPQARQVPHIHQQYPDSGYDRPPHASGGLAAAAPRSDVLPTPSRPKSGQRGSTPGTGLAARPNDAAMRRASHPQPQTQQHPSNAHPRSGSARGVANVPVVGLHLTGPASVVRHPAVRDDLPAFAHAYLDLVDALLLWTRQLEDARGATPISSEQAAGAPRRSSLTGAAAAAAKSGFTAAGNGAAARSVRGTDRGPRPPSPPRPPLAEALRTWRAGNGNKPPVGKTAVAIVCAAIRDRLVRAHQIATVLLAQWAQVQGSLGESEQPGNGNDANAAAADKSFTTSKRRSHSLRVLDSLFKVSGEAAQWASSVLATTKTATTNSIDGDAGAENSRAFESRTMWLEMHICVGLDDFFARVAEALTSESNDGPGSNSPPRAGGDKQQTKTPPPRQVLARSLSVMCSTLASQLPTGPSPQQLPASPALMASSPGSAVMDRPGDGRDLSTILAATLPVPRNPLNPRASGNTGAAQLTVADRSIWQALGWMHLAVRAEERIYQLARRRPRSITPVYSSPGGGAASSPAGPPRPAASAAWNDCAAPVTLPVAARAHATKLVRAVHLGMDRARAAVRYTRALHARLERVALALYCSQIQDAAFPSRSGNNRAAGGGGGSGLKGAASVAAAAGILAAAPQSMDPDAIDLGSANENAAAHHAVDLLECLEAIAQWLAGADAPGRDGPAFAAPTATTAAQTRAAALHTRLAACLCDLGIELPMWSAQEMAEMQDREDAQLRPGNQIRSLFTETHSAIVAERLVLAPGSLRHVATPPAVTDQKEAGSDAAGATVDRFGSAIWCGQPVLLQPLDDQPFQVATQRVALALGVAHCTALAQLHGLVHLAAPPAGALARWYAVFEGGAHPSRRLAPVAVRLAARSTDGGLDPRVASVVARAVVSALLVLQTHGVPHPGVCPSNVLVSEDWRDVKLAGLWTTTAPDVEMRRYTPPESQGDQILLDEDAWFAAHVYQVGVLLWELIMVPAQFDISKRELICCQDDQTATLILAALDPTAAARPALVDLLHALDRVSEIDGVSSNLPLIPLPPGIPVVSANQRRGSPSPTSHTSSVTLFRREKHEASRSRVLDGTKFAPPPCGGGVLCSNQPSSRVLGGGSVRIVSPRTSVMEHSVATTNSSSPPKPRPVSYPVTQSQIIYSPRRESALKAAEKGKSESSRLPLSPFGRSKLKEKRASDCPASPASTPGTPKSGSNSSSSKRLSMSSGNGGGGILKRITNRLVFPIGRSKRSSSTSDSPPMDVHRNSLQDPEPTAGAIVEEPPKPIVVHLADAQSRLAADDVAGAALCLERGLDQPEGPNLAPEGTAIAARTLLADLFWYGSSGGGSLLARRPAAAATLYQVARLAPAAQVGLGDVYLRAPNLLPPPEPAGSAEQLPQAATRALAFAHFRTALATAYAGHDTLAGMGNGTVNADKAGSPGGSGSAPPPVAWNVRARAHIGVAETLLRAAAAGDPAACEPVGRQGALHAALAHASAAADACSEGAMERDRRKSEGFAVLVLVTAELRRLRLNAGAAGARAALALGNAQAGGEWLARAWDACHSDVPPSPAAIRRVLMQEPGQMECNSNALAVALAAWHNLHGNMRLAAMWQIEASMHPDV